MQWCECYNRNVYKVLRGEGSWMWEGDHRGGIYFWTPVMFQALCWESITSSYSVFKKSYKEDVDHCPHISNKTKNEWCADIRDFREFMGLLALKPMHFSNLAYLLGGLIGNCKQVIFYIDHSDPCFLSVIFGVFAPFLLKEFLFC